MNDINKPVTNPELVEAIHNMIEDNSTDAQNAMINELMKAHFLSPAKLSPQPKRKEKAANGEIVLKEDTAINFTLIQNSNGETFFPVFTDWDELHKWLKDENQQTIVTTFDDLAALILKPGTDFAGFVINPFGESINIPEELVNDLKEQKDRIEGKSSTTEMSVESEAPIMFSQPKKYPTDMINAITAFLKTQGNVSAAYMQLMFKNGDLSYLIIVDFTGDKNKIFNGIGSAA
ncbi:MAG TPA: enhanced serine sensitivity protein SseB C-terminal domain-containing protein, partial [Mobilitalea sp.]|nr:enhanced serine sensitivity protein SseB C-terminal domain-containing protein [Mobilitalea sp.]